MKLAASKVDFRSGCEVGVTVVFVAPADVTTEGVVGVGEEGRVVGLAVELVGTGVVGITKQESELFFWVQLLTDSLEQ